MKDYMLIFRGGLDHQNASPEELQQSMMKWMGWMEELKATDKYIGGDRLTGSGAVISGPQKQLSDGPYAEGKEVVGGYIAIKAANLEEAIELSMGCPIYNYGGSTEIQEILKM